MNVYPCWYLGLSGYCCRSHNLKWMFVPEMGQHNNRIHKRISLNDLVFNNVYAKEYELKIEQGLDKIRMNPFRFIRSLLFPARKSGNVIGMLLTPA